MATATAPPSIKTISLPMLAAAAPVCRPGLPAVVVTAFAPAVPLGVGAEEIGAGTTVTAVTVLWLPSGRVVVWRIVEVIEREESGPPDIAALDTAAEEADESLGDNEEAPADGVNVTKPPPTVLMIVTPDPSVVVNTAPEDVGGADGAAALDWP